ncbi:class I SAM-dependent methyltransferase [Streptomyces sp. NPDC058268]|uniref:class I SAM-dependent methyltransferase n=1 Tax=Streptomyces sp. NPDC058268 TaxID=3346413 RepID=UPI0036EE4202
MSDASRFDRYGGPFGVLPDRTGQAEAFDAIGQYYDDAFPRKDGQLAAGRWLSDALPPGSRVLDVGCGTGVPTARQLADAGHTVLGIDLSSGMLALARKNVPGQNAEFRQLDVAALRAEGPEGVGKFDGIAAFFALLMLPRAEIPYALRLLHGLLRPGGLLALSMVEADLDDAGIPFLGHTIRVSGYLRGELRQVVRDAGFDIVEEDTYSYTPAGTDVSPSSPLRSTRGGPNPEHQLFLHCRRG